MKRFRDSLLLGNFTITAELMLMPDSNAADVRGQCQRLRGLVDTMLGAYSPWPWLQMSPLAASALVLQEGQDALPVLTCRDRNRIALFSYLMGLRALGVSSVMLVRGHRLSKEHQVPARTVFSSRHRAPLIGGKLSTLNEESRKSG